MLAQRHLSGIRINRAGENLQQRRLARAIWPNQSDAVPLGDGEGDVAKERSAP